MKKRILTLILALSLLVSLLAGCAGSSKPTESAETQQSETTAETSEAPAAQAPAEDSTAAAEAGVDQEVIDAAAQAAEAGVVEVPLPISEEPLTYTMWMTIPFFIVNYVDTMSKDITVLNEIQQRSNIFFDITEINGETETEKFNLMIAANEYCDIINGMDNYSTGLSGAVDDEVAIDLYDLVREYAPNYWYHISQYSECLTSLITDEGYMPTLAILYKDAGAESRGLLIRKDWLDQLGMEVPQTIDQMHDALVGFKDNFGAEGVANYEEFGFGFDTSTGGGFMVNDGKIVSGYYDQNYYDYLAMMAQWYQEGIINKDYYYLGEQDYDGLFSDGSIGLISGQADKIVTISAMSSDENITLWPLGRLKKNVDDEIHYGSEPSVIKDKASWAISTECGDPVPLMKLVNFMFTDAGELLFNYGIEGQAYTLDENGEPQWTDLMINNPDGLAYFFTSYLYATNNAAEYIPALMDTSKNNYAYTDAQWAAYDLFKEVGADLSYNVPAGVKLNADETAEAATIQTDIETLVDETVSAWVMGTAVMDDAAIATFQSELERLGIDRLIEIQQGAYERYLEKMEAFK